MKFWYILAFIILAVITNSVIDNMNQHDILLDSSRYIKILNLDIDVNSFTLVTNFLIIGFLGSIIYDATKSWTMTFAALLGFSVSLMLWGSFLAQAWVMIVALWLWINAEPFEKEDGEHLNKGYLFFIIGFALCAIHELGSLLILIIFTIKAFESNLKKYAPFMAIIGYIFLGVLLFTDVIYTPGRVDFFYYFLLPVSMGSWDIVYWYLYFGVLLFMVYKCKDNTRELLMAAACFFAAIMHYLFVSHLEIDIWRMLIFFELLAWVKIAKGKNEWVKWLPIILLLMGIERLAVGLMVGH